MLKLDSISKSFDEKPVLQNISLEIEEGERFSLLGQSGCGKSTTALTLLQLEPITSGQIFFQDQELTKLDEDQIKLTIKRRCNKKEKKIESKTTPLSKISSLENFLQAVFI